MHSVPFRIPGDIPPPLHPLIEQFYSDALRMRFGFVALPLKPSGRRFPIFLDFCAVGGFPGLARSCLRTFRRSRSACFLRNMPPVTVPALFAGCRFCFVLSCGLRIAPRLSEGIYRRWFRCMAFGGWGWFHAACRTSATASTSPFGIRTDLFFPPTHACQRSIIKLDVVT